MSQDPRTNQPPSKDKPPTYNEDKDKKKPGTGGQVEMPKEERGKFGDRVRSA